MRRGATTGLIALASLLFTQVISQNSSSSLAKQGGKVGGKNRMEAAATLGGGRNCRSYLVVLLVIQPAAAWVVERGGQVEFALGQHIYIYF